MNEIKLNDLLKISSNDLINYKLRLSTIYKDPQSNEILEPLDFFLYNKEEFYDYINWKKLDSKKSIQYNFDRLYIIHLIQMNKKNRFLFVGVHEVMPGDNRSLNDNGVVWVTKEVPEYSMFSGRTILKYEPLRGFQTAVPKPEAIYKNSNKPFIDHFIVEEITSNPYEGAKFSGYENINISYPELQQIAISEPDSWKTALSSVKGIYVITDTNNGKLYVGKANGKNMIWQRWMSYARSYHGGNTSLKELYNNEGDKYFYRYLKLSLLEIFKSTTDDKYIDQRESYWKNVLDSRNNGYNDN
ncbi:GIY-YIG nuclease family protein [Vagococcus fluvialis]|uniref:GIY-YIG nuclease family protein n=1 Tax=Vagococcus fluvialis TaxID=2738 RepID=A0A7X6D926_9ENTE|nr:GIY-YIG nuclease family protein [Vagococcus fluvialis]NKC68022.1 GIY-YIG nuclease family protein [Vagococcus fluvialis]